MSTRTILTLVLALAFGGSAAVGINALNKNTAAPSADTVTVVVAASSISRFTTITADMLKTSEVSKELVPSGSFARVEDVIERVADANFLKGEPLLDPKLTAKGSGRGAAAAIPTGMRAVTIKTPSAEAGVAGFILPGNRVDVLLTTRDNPEDATGGGSSSTLVENVEIMAVDQQVDAPSENKVSLKDLRSVTLLVTPEQVAKIDLGQNMGTLHLALRNPLDQAPAVNAAATLKGIRTQAKQPWDDRLKGMLEAASKLLASRPVARPPAKPAPVTPEPPPPPLMIRTLRSTFPSTVPVQ